MAVSLALLIAVTFVWLGMVLAISFLEAPLKFRAPGVTLALGLGIGRIVFKALYVCELLFAVVIVAELVSQHEDAVATSAVVVAAVVLVIQLLAVRPALTRRSDAVLSGAVAEGGPRSHTHLYYVALEVAKVVALIVGGVALLAK